jgi:transposase
MNNHLSLTTSNFPALWGLTQNTPAGTTVLSSIRLNDNLVYTTYQGGTTTQRFREYMKEQLISSLEKDDVVIMDNMRSHHAKIVTKLLDKASISYMYLPPYIY